MPPPSRTTAPLGRTGLDVTRVGLGAWAIGGPWDFGWGPQDDADSVAAIHAAIDQGLGWIDTAAVYGLGHSEEVVGRAVRELPEEDRPLVFTKCGMSWDDDGKVTRVGAPDAIRRGVQDSLRRLGVEAIDLMQIHWPPDDGTPEEEAWGALVELREKGDIRFAGVSNFSPAQLDACEAVGHVDTLQPPLSLLERTALSTSIEWAATHETGVIVYSPMQSGLLSGGWSRERTDQLADGDWRRDDEQFTGDLLDRNLALVERLRPIAAREDCSPAELAVAWTLHQHGVTAAIVGARRPDQIGDWVHAGEQYLPDDTREEIAAALRDTSAGWGPIPPTVHL